MCCKNKLYCDRQSKSISGALRDSLCPLSFYNSSKRCVQKLIQATTTTVIKKCSFLPVFYVWLAHTVYYPVQFIFILLHLNYSGLEWFTIFLCILDTIHIFDKGLQIFGSNILTFVFILPFNLC